MQLRDIMSTRVVTIGPEEDARLARKRMRRQHIRHLVVVDDGSIVGVLSARDVHIPGSPAEREGSVEELMSTRVETASPETSLEEAAERMQEARVGSLPIVEGESLVGIVTSTDVLDELGRGELRARARPRVRAARARPRKVDARERAPLAKQVPRPAKRRAGRTEVPREVPANVRVFGTHLEPSDRAYIRRKLGAKIGKYAPAIERVSVRVADVNGPRGGIDQQCRIKAVLSGYPSVLYEAQDASRDTAIDAAIGGIERVLRRTLRRRREKPMSLRSYGERASAEMRG